ncbi:GARP complex component (Vps54) [Sporothrix schenckii 1099-18]|uniref:GARP complex component (Vps54) n=1 Tax=Sporothrix schenckii 1099-18 TaxID=1397361 RepID=A0A0F2LUG4_SPOSC|nr:GARP complex component (Vps54) [Sporothrix schenckii 1099-18]KJR81118.1 GARP complex component (Vps54) [Sporothrix schenckii 1099-18]
MYSNSDGRKSVDSLTSPAGVTHRADFPFHKQRRESVASSTTSIGGTLDTAVGGGGWPNTLQEAGQNAISTLLQPPIVRSGFQPHTAAPAHSTHKPPTSRDIPPVKLTNIEQVDSSEFSSYLRQVGRLHEQLHRAKEREDEQLATAIGTPRNNSKEDLGESAADGHLRPSASRRTSSTRRLSVSSISSATLVDAPSPVRRSSSNFRRQNLGPPPLSTIPSVYFDESFHLENPRTFDIVSERAQVISTSLDAESEKDKDAAHNGGASNSTAAPRKTLANNQILQEKLSWYMDTVEMHLISSISTASSAFFTALGALKELHTEAADSVDRIKALRTELGGLDEEVAVRGLDIVQKQRRQQNTLKFRAAVLQLQDIVSGVTACDSLIDAGDVDKALDSIDALEKLIAGEHDPKANVTQPRGGYALCDLRGAAALQGVGGDIASLRFRIGKAYEAKFVTALMKDIRNHAETVSSQDVLMRWNSAAMRSRGGHNREPSAFPAYLASTDELRSELLPILTGLYRAKHVAAAVQAFREAVQREIKSLIRRPLPSSNDDDNESVMSSSTAGSSRNLSQHEKSSNLARNLRALDPQDAEELLVKVYIGVTETLRRFTTHGKVLLDVASSVGDDQIPEGLRSPPFSPSGRPMQHISDTGMAVQGEVHKTLDVSNLLGQAVDVAQDKIVKLLRVRQEQSSSLSLKLFLRYFTLNVHFANECEAISGRSGTSLKNVVNMQIKDFLKGYGDAEKQKLAVDMDKDQWIAKDVSDEDNEVLQRILNASTKDAPSWTTDVKLWIPITTDDFKESTDNPASLSTDAVPDAAAANGKAKVRGATIDEETFSLPASALVCIQGISRYMHLAVAIPFMTAEVASTLVQYLQLFNSRCTQLILGAGATRTAGLKNINTRNLAIAAQSLSFLATLVPYVREFFRRRANSVPGVTASSLMGDFDKVRRLYQEHQNNIFEKLMEIMSARAQVHARTMAKITWDNDDSEPGVHAYMETLVKDTITLHRNLVKNLPESSVRFIMVPVFASYTEHLSSVLTTAEVRTRKGQEKYVLLTPVADENKRNKSSELTNYNSMLQDLDYFKNRLSKIDGFEKTGDVLRTIATNKVIKPPTPPPPPAVPVVEPSVERKPSGESLKETTKETDKEANMETAKKGDVKAENKAKEDSDNDDSAPPPPPPKDGTSTTTKEAEKNDEAKLETKLEEKEAKEEEKEMKETKEEKMEIEEDKLGEEKPEKAEPVETVEKEEKPAPVESKMVDERARPEAKKKDEPKAEPKKSEASKKNKKKKAKKAAAKKAAAKKADDSSSEEGSGDEK